MKANLDDIAAKLPPRNISPRRTTLAPYRQRMQSRYGSRKFYLYTHELVGKKVRLELIESVNNDLYMIGTRNADMSEDDIKRAVKSLERKAGCKLYYVLLISTDGDYL